jgi:hypothetical protein
VTTFSKEKVLEKRDLQDMLKNNISIIAPDFLVLAEEFGDWEDSRRRIDILCIDKLARLIVVELKRTEDGGHMDLQSVRYAAMISTMTFSEAVEAHGTFVGITRDEARSSILDFLDWEAPHEDEFGSEVRIVLISAEFSKEIMTTVMWLAGFDVDISCIKLRPYRHDGKVLVDIQKIFPLPEAEDYQIKIRKKEKEERSGRIQSRDTTRFFLDLGKDKIIGLAKRELVYYVARVAFNKGSKPLEIVTNSRRWVIVGGKHDEESFLREAEKNRTVDSSLSEIGRFYSEKEKLFYSGGKTYALTKMWGETALPTIDELIEKFNLAITYRPVKPEDFE